jgi:thiamine pyrophosphokinase
VVAADAGARHATTLGLTIDQWVGDGDSLDPADQAALVARGVPMTFAPTDKDESDTELAVRAALERSPASMVILGAHGGLRLDHALANVGLLAMADLRDLPTTILSATSRIRLVHDHAVLDGRIGDLVTLLPVGGDTRGVTTTALRYPLRDETLLDGRTRGLSNVRTATRAEVHLRDGRLLVIETPATL